MKVIDKDYLTLKEVVAHVSEALNIPKKEAYYVLMEAYRKGELFPVGAPMFTAH